MLQVVHDERFVCELLAEECIERFEECGFEVDKNTQLYIESLSIAELVLVMCEINRLDDITEAVPKACPVGQQYVEIKIPGFLADMLQLSFNF